MSYDKCFALSFDNLIKSTFSQKLTLLRYLAIEYVITNNAGKSNITCLNIGGKSIKPNCAKPIKLITVGAKKPMIKLPREYRNLFFLYVVYCLFCLLLFFCGMLVPNSKKKKVVFFYYGNSQFKHTKMKNKTQKVFQTKKTKMWQIHTSLSRDMLANYFLSFDHTILFFVDLLRYSYVW